MRNFLPCFAFLMEPGFLWFAFNFSASRFQSGFFACFHPIQKQYRCYHVCSLYKGVPPPPKLGFWCNSSTTRNHIPEFACQHHAEITQSHPFAPLIRLSKTTHNLLTINASEISSNNSEKLSLLADKHHWTFLLYSSYSSPGWTVTRRLRGLKLRSIVRQFLHLVRYVL